MAFSLLIFLLGFIPLRGVFAQELSRTSTPQVDYELPYPGLLPDSPLYILKVARDKIVSFLISDPLKKAEFDLLQADKRLNAGIYLFNSAQNDKKIQLAVSTISKGENYFEESLGKAKEARLEGMEINEITRKLINSAKKHQEELDALEKKSAQNFKESFGRERKRAGVFEKEARELISKK